MDHWRRVFPGVEAVLLSTCNRVEIYAATEHETEPGLDQIAGFLARFHGLDPAEVAEHLYQYSDDAAVQHLFTVASSLDSMVLGEPQILAQVKEAYQTATEQDNTGPLLHATFQAALRVARRVAKETTIHQRRVSVPSVAVADFARQVFERFDDKHALVIGAGEMAEEMPALPARRRGPAGDGRQSALRPGGRIGRPLAGPRRRRGRISPRRWPPPIWSSAPPARREPVVTRRRFAEVEALRFERPLLILDLAVPRDFEPADRRSARTSISTRSTICRRSAGGTARQRDRELPAAMHIVEQETTRFMAEMRRHAVGPVIERLRQGWQKPKEEELERLLNKLPELDDRAREEIRRSFDRLVNKLLHPPLESLRDESREGVPRGLLDALARLFQLKD